MTCMRLKECSHTFEMFIEIAVGKGTFRRSGHLRRQQRPLPIPEPLYLQRACRKGFGYIYINHS